MDSVEFNSQLHFTSGWVDVTLLRDFFGNCLSKDPFLHMHHMFELHYIEKGSCTVEMNKESIDCREGQFLILPPRCLHRLLPHSDEVQTITLTFGLQEESTGFSVFRTNDVLLCEDDFGGRGRLLSVREELAQKKPAYVEKIRGELAVLLAEVIRKLGQKEELVTQANEHRAEMIDAYLVEHRFDPDCSCEELAQRMHLSTRQLQRICLQYYGATFRQLLISMRMQTAAYRLSTTDVAISDLALQLGYASVASFSAAYKRYFGRSPSQEKSAGERM